MNISYRARIDSKSTFEGFNVVHSGAEVCGSKLGYATYVGMNTQLANVQIGRYCSIANNVEVLSFTHPSKRFVSTHPAFYSLLEQSGFTYTKQQRFNEFLELKNAPGYSLIIGNDVWIGTKCLIMGGLEIGNGAIISAGSVVTKTVPPYAIVGGVPAKTIRMRFSKEEIEFLEQFKWWEIESRLLRENSEIFSSIDHFMKSCNRIKSI